MGHSVGGPGSTDQASAMIKLNIAYPSITTHVWYMAAKENHAVKNA